MRHSWASTDCLAGSAAAPGAGAGVAWGEVREARALGLNAPRQERALREEGALAAAAWVLAVRAARRAN